MPHDLPNALPDDLRCPVCEAPLAAGLRAFTCAHGHTFDRARQGYVNLLRPTRLHGDPPEMLRARRRFLTAGWYAPLADAIAQEVGAWLTGPTAAMAPLETRALLDAGCGEGYYLSELAQALTPALAVGGWRLYGMDLAKEAVRLAATRAAGMALDATWLVGNSKDRLPFAEAGLGALLTIFAPRQPAEFARALTPGGLLLVVTPAPEHLAEARAALPWLLTPEPAKDARLRATLEAPGAFTLAQTRAVNFALALDAAALGDLAHMTPHRPLAPETPETPDALAEAVRAATAEAPDGRLNVRAACLIRSYIRR